MTPDAPSPTPHLFPVDHVTKHPCPQCGTRQWLQGVTYYRCASCGYRDGPTPEEIPHSTELCGGGCHRSAKAARGEELEIQEPVVCQYASAVYFHPTLASVLGPSLIRHEVV
jgi:hypothetical protein